MIKWRIALEKHINRKLCEMSILIVLSISLHISLLFGRNFSLASKSRLKIGKCKETRKQTKCPTPK